MLLRAIAVLLAGVTACTSFSAPDSRSEGAGPDGGGIDASVGDAAPDDGASDGRATGTLKAFVTSVGYADVTTSADADAKCTAEATGRLPGTFVAWYPDPLQKRSAPSRIVTLRGDAVDGPWFRVDGKRVAANRAALTNTSAIALENPIDLTAAGIRGGGGVWTGTLPDGGIGTTCPGVNPTSGNASSTDASWTAQTFFTATCGSSLRLYCFQVE